MKAIEFKRKGLLYYLHKFIYKNDPQDTCTYKGQLIISFIVCSLTLHATILRSVLMSFKQIRKDDDYWGYKFHFAFVMSSILFILVGEISMENNSIIHDFIYWHHLSFIEMIYYSFITMFIGIIVMLVVGIGLTIIGLIIFGGYLLIEIIYNKIKPLFPKKEYKYKEEPETQFGVLYKSIKEKWCKRIIWK